MSGKWVEIEDDFQGYLSFPEAGGGPGLLLLQETFGVTKFLRAVADNYASEGYVVLVPDLFWRFEPRLELDEAGPGSDKANELYRRFSVNNALTDIVSSLEILRERPEQVGKVGCLGFCLGGTLAYLTAAETDVDCAVGYYGAGIEEELDRLGEIQCPIVLHQGEKDSFIAKDAQKQIRDAFAERTNMEFFVYPGVEHAFAAVGRESFDKAAASMAYSRTLALFRDVMGPRYDLSKLWDTHTALEFGDRDVEATMGTMVASPYVNHIPTMTGGVGYEDLANFYREHFIFSNPPDTSLMPVSRTVGVDRVVDEMVFSCTHTCEIPWMLPGVPPTGRKIEVPLVAIVNFRGEKLYHEHIYWDQASVLTQIGWLDPSGLPVAGVETAKKLLDESLPSNELIGGALSPPSGAPILTGSE